MSELDERIEKEVTERSRRAIERLRWANRDLDGEIEKYAPKPINWKKEAATVLFVAVLLYVVLWGCMAL